MSYHYHLTPIFYDRVLRIEQHNNVAEGILISGAALLTGEAALLAVGRFGVVTANGYEATLFTRGFTSATPQLSTPYNAYETAGFALRFAVGLVK